MSGVVASGVKWNSDIDDIVNKCCGNTCKFSLVFQLSSHSTIFLAFILSKLMNSNASDVYFFHILNQHSVRPISSTIITTTSFPLIYSKGNHGSCGKQSRSVPAVINNLTFVVAVNVSIMAGYHGQFPKSIRFRFIWFWIH